MDTRQQITEKIYEIEDRIRRAPQDTPHKIVFDWYLEIDRLKEEYGRQDELYGPLLADESNSLGMSNADFEDAATGQEREAFVEEWNRDSDEPQTWSQIVGTAK